MEPLFDRASKINQYKEAFLNDKRCGPNRNRGRQKPKWQKSKIGRSKTFLCKESTSQTVASPARETPNNTQGAPQRKWRNYDSDVTPSEADLSLVR